MNDASLRKHIQSLLRGGGAHLSFEQAIADLPAPLRGEKPPGAAHTIWQVVEHMRIAQWDILEFSRDPKHVSPEFPTAYWPRAEDPQDAPAWERSLALFRADLAAMAKLVADPKRDLFARVEHPEAKDEHTLLREALLVADHNAYHLGELVLIRRLLRSWNSK
jgi:hypothetical protein